MGAALLLGVLALGLEVFALVDALRQPPAAFLAAGKRTKGLWVGITVAASLVGFVSVNNPISMVSILAVVGAAVYLTDVRPALNQVRGRGGSSGPYGPW
ncbi:MAG: DUF2516 family protein [Actinomycetales bacterium]|nr:DUF2516 family protein [Candidatus Lutibacillus vidarii]